MAITAITTGNFISDILIEIRDDILSAVTDPISSIRPANEKFVMTSYPKRQVQYPCITVQPSGINQIARMGLRS